MDGDVIFNQIEDFLDNQIIILSGINNLPE